MEVGDKVKICSKALENFVKGKDYSLEEDWLSSMRILAEEETVGEIVLIFNKELIVNFSNTPGGDLGLQVAIVEKV